MKNLSIDQYHNRDETKENFMDWLSQICKAKIAAGEFYNDHVYDHKDE